MLFFLLETVRRFLFFFLAPARLVSRGEIYEKLGDFWHKDRRDHLAFRNPSGVDSIVTDYAKSGISMNTGQISSASALGVYPESGDNSFAQAPSRYVQERLASTRTSELSMYS